MLEKVRIATLEKSAKMTVTENCSAQLPNKKFSPGSLKNNSGNALAMNENYPSSCSCSTEVRFTLLSTEKYIPFKYGSPDPKHTAVRPCH